jgi:hypothetical protein
MEFEEEAIFKHPFRCLIAGPSESGKTNLVKNIQTISHIVMQNGNQNMILLKILIATLNLFKAYLK